jgi:(p)ppGpp synthase/HD superfamily hydrolase
MVRAVIVKARNFAWHQHYGQFRKYMKNVPYFVHPERVAIAVQKDRVTTEEMVAAAYVHDTLEDTKTTYDDILRWFGDTVAEYVLGLTSYSKQISLAGYRAARKKADLEYLSKQKKEVHYIKLEDRWDNLNDIEFCPDQSFIDLYCRESRDLIGDVNKGRADQILELCGQLEKMRDGI